MKFLLAMVVPLLAVGVRAEHFGAPITRAHAVSLEEAVTTLGKQRSADILIEAKVDKVCEQRGCWIGLASASGEIHATFKDEAFVVPLSLKGKTVRAQGTLTKIAMSLEETRQSVAANGGDPAAVKLPGVRYEFVASGIEVISAFKSSPSPSR